MSFVIIIGSFRNTFLPKMSLVLPQSLCTAKVQNVHLSICSWLFLVIGLQIKYLNLLREVFPDWPIWSIHSVIYYHVLYFNSQCNMHYYNWLLVNSLFFNYSALFAVSFTRLGTLFFFSVAKSWAQTVGVP